MSGIWPSSKIWPGQRWLASDGSDTWVDCAGVAIYAALVDTPAKEHERMFRTNYFGVVHGSLTALKYLRERGGALITVGSIASYFPSPIMGAYSFGQLGKASPPCSRSAAGQASISTLRHARRFGLSLIVADFTMDLSTAPRRLVASA
jgi:NAD(P)-dependent dehydrogenase (short-subunit alcohol dehydrogenase family)